jgi:Transposase DNA-binding/Transposase Tn5 dimerisation domain
MRPEIEPEWAEEEFSGAELGDKRLTARLVQLASVLGEKPQSSLPDASGEAATLKAAYRFFDNEGVKPEGMLASHIEATYRRMASVPLVLAVQDTTYLDWTSHPDTQGLGPLASASRQGLLAHSTLAISAERVPLGVLAQQVWARDAETFAQLQDHKQRVIEEKESHKWLKSLEAVEVAHQACPNTHFVSVGDREADIYDLFLVERSDGVDLLVRAANDRRVEAEERYLWAALEATPIGATAEVKVPPRHGQAARTASLAIHWREILLRPPTGRAQEKLAPVKVWALWAIETAPPANLPAVEWLLLTTVPVHTPADALQRLDWYACRWGIEVWHKILKSGCRIEARQLETADRLKRCLTLYAVIAWRVLYATMLSRSVPEVSCLALLNDAEWQALYCAIHNTTLLPASPPSLNQAVRWIAQLGGFQNRKGDGHPGVTVIWKGFQHLSDLTYMYLVFRPQPSCKDVGND